jgi:hypothetical protein
VRERKGAAEGAVRQRGAKLGSLLRLVRQYMRRRECERTSCKHCCKAAVVNPRSSMAESHQLHVWEQPRVQYIDVWVCFIGLSDIHYNNLQLRDLLSSKSASTYVKH